MKVTMKCRHCHGENIRFDATAVWSVEAQQWEISTIHDFAECDDCDGQTHAYSEEIAQ